MTGLVLVLLAQVPVCGNGKLDRTQQMICASCPPGAPCACGNVEVVEECDGALVPTTCAAQGWAGGTMKCTAQCRLDASDCQVTPPELGAKTVKLAPDAEWARVIAGERGNVGLLEVSHRQLAVSSIWPPNLTVNRRGAASVQPTDDGGDGFARAHGFPSRDGWVLVSEQYPGFLATWMLPDRGNMRGPTERLWLGPSEPLFCDSNYCGFLHGDGPSARLVVSTVGSDGILGQHPLKALVEPPARLSGAAGIATDSGALVAAVTDKAVIVFSMNPRGETAEVDRIATPAKSAAWARGADAPWLVWSDADGFFAVPFTAAGKRDGRPMKLPEAKGPITAAAFRGKQLYAIAGNQLVSTKAVPIIAGPNIELVSSYLGEGYAWFVWRKRQNTPGGPMSLTQVPLK